MDNSLCDQWMTSNFTPNKYEVFISVARAFTIISASEKLLLLHIYVWYRQKGVAATCAYSCVHARELLKLIALAHKTFWICLHSWGKFLNISVVKLFHSL